MATIGSNAHSEDNAKDTQSIKPAVAEEKRRGSSYCMGNFIAGAPAPPTARQSYALRPVVGHEFVWRVYTKHFLHIYHTYICMHGYVKLYIMHIHMYIHFMYAPIKMPTLRKRTIGSCRGVIFVQLISLLFLLLFLHTCLIN